MLKELGLSIALLGGVGAMAGLSVSQENERRGNLRNAFTEAGYEIVGSGSQIAFLRDGEIVGHYRIDPFNGSYFVTTDEKARKLAIGHARVSRTSLSPFPGY